MDCVGPLDEAMTDRVNARKAFWCIAMRPEAMSRLDDESLDRHIRDGVPWAALILQIFRDERMRKEDKQRVLLHGIRAGSLTENILRFLATTPECIPYCVGETRDQIFHIHRQLHLANTLWLIVDHVSFSVTGIFASMKFIRAEAGLFRHIAIHPQWDHCFAEFLNLDSMAFRIARQELGTLTTHQCAMFYRNLLYSGDLMNRMGFPPCLPRTAALVMAGKGGPCQWNTDNLEPSLRFFVRAIRLRLESTPVL